MSRRMVWLAVTAAVAFPLGHRGAAAATRDALADALMAWVGELAGPKAAGRGLGTEGHRYAVTRLEEAARGLGLQRLEAPMAKLQLPVVRLSIGSQTSLSQAGIASGDLPQLPGVDVIPYMPVSMGYPARRRAVGTFGTVYLGPVGSQTRAAPSAWRNKFVLVDPPRRGGIGVQHDVESFAEELAALRGAAAIGVIVADIAPAPYVARLTAARLELAVPAVAPPQPPILLLTQQAAAFARTDRQGIVTMRFHIDEERLRPAPTLLAFVLPGSDPQRRDEVLLLTAPSDGLGQRRGALGELVTYAGADDGASGAAALLGIAQELAAAPTRPARSIVFLWHAGTEHGLLGSEWALRQQLVPRERLVAVLNMDRLGRGGDTLFAVGARRRPSPLVGWIDSSAARAGQPLSWARDTEALIRRWDCSADHVNYARAGVPAVTIGSDVHEDWRQPTDVVERIDAPRYAARVRWLAALARDLADRPERALPPVRGAFVPDRRCTP
jgi:hypothetical protein